MGLGTTAAIPGIYPKFENKPGFESSYLMAHTTEPIDNSIYSDIMNKDAVISALARIRRNPANVRFSDLRRVCDHYFGRPRQSGGSHWIYGMPWAGDPRINIQNSKGMAKGYQVRQVLAAIDKLEAKHEPNS